MGPLDALNLTRAVIERWDPSHIILVGIAGSFHEDVKLGDVIVSQQVFYYDLAKATEGVLEYRPEGYPCSVSLIRQIHAISVSPEETDAWRRAARKSAHSKASHLTLKNVGRLSKARSALDSHAPSIHVGAMASGSLVIADPSKKEELLRLHGKLLGTEMEGAGVMHAAFFNDETPKSAIIIKGISDAADKNKAKMDAKGFWRELAGENSVRLALAIIRRGRLRPTLADQFDLETTLASAAEAKRILPMPSTAGVALLAFGRLVRPRGEMSRLEIVATLTSAGEPVSVLQARVLYQSKGQRVERALEPGLSIRFLTDDRIDPQPIGLYMMAGRDPDLITLEVRSGNSRRLEQVKL
jgi:nucleoside phosphorylase